MIVKERFFVTFFLKKQKNQRRLRHFHGFSHLKKNKKLLPTCVELLFVFLLIFFSDYDTLSSNIYSPFVLYDIFNTVIQLTTESHYQRNSIIILRKDPQHYE